MKNKYVKIQILAIAIILLGTLTASAGKNTDEVSIKLDFKQGPFDGTDGTSVGRWHAKGAYVDGGKALDTYVWEMEPPEVTMTSRYILGGKDGDLVIDVVLYTNVATDWVKSGELKFTGEWVIDTDDCTGMYEGVTGGGDAVQLVHVVAASNVAGGVQDFGSPAMSNRVFLEGTIN